MKATLWTLFGGIGSLAAGACLGGMAAALSGSVALLLSWMVGVDGIGLVWRLCSAGAASGCILGLLRALDHSFDWPEVLAARESRAARPGPFRPAEPALAPSREDVLCSPSLGRLPNGSAEH